MTLRMSNLLTHSFLTSVARAFLTFLPSSTSMWVTQTFLPSSSSNSSSMAMMSLLSMVVLVVSETSPSLNTTGTSMSSGILMVSLVTRPQELHLNVPSIVAFPILPLRIWCSVSSSHTGHS